MRFECSRTNLVEAINTVQKAVSSRSTIPILDGILLAVSYTHLDVYKRQDLFNIEGRRRRISETPVRINKISYLIRDSHSDRAIIEALQDQLHFIIYPTDIREGIPPGCNKKTGMILLEKWLQLSLIHI